MKTVLILTLIFPVSSGLLAQHTISGNGVDTAWVRHYYTGNIAAADHAAAMTIDGLGNVYVVGTSQEIGASNFCTVKYDSGGNLLWVRKYDGTANYYDAAKALAVDDSGYVYVTGISTVIQSNGYVCATIKYNSVGDTVWLRQEDVVSYSYLAGIAADRHGNVIVTGDAGTIKYNGAGERQWITAWVASKVAVTENGNVCASGTSGTNLYDSTGKLLWTKPHSTASMTVDPNGNIYVAEGSDTSFIVTKYDTAGRTVWTSQVLASGGPVAIVVDGGNSVYITGLANSIFDNEYLTVKFNSAGDSVWVRRYNGPSTSYDWPVSLTVDGSGNVYVTGYSGSAGPPEFATVKYNAAGNEEWVARYSAGDRFDNRPVGVCMDGAGAIYVAGASQYLYDPWTQLNEYTIIKYVQSPLSTTGEYSSFPTSLALSQNYPNPFNPTTEIQYHLPFTIHHSLIVYDLLGREVATLVNEERSAGVYRVPWDGSRMSSGVYFYRLTAGSFVETKKMVLMK